jgi:hypothetical protein
MGRRQKFVLLVLAGGDSAHGKDQSHKKSSQLEFLTYPRSASSNPFKTLSDNYKAQFTSLCKILSQRMRKTYW